MNLYVGCAGWEYKDWIGPFYPKNLEQHKHLDYYAKIFDYTEINSPFYNLPSQDIIYKWLNQVDNDFKYTIKVWKEITHNIHREDLDYYIYNFFEQFKPLYPKIENFLFQFPPWFKYSEKNVNRLTYLFDLIPNDLNYVVEFRDNSWFKDQILSTLIQTNNVKNVILATTYLKGVSSYYYKDQSSYYIRLIGDRSITEFDRVQRTFDDEINEIIKKVIELKDLGKIKEIFIIVNNHYTGFAPETVNRIKKDFNLPFKKFNYQKNLLDFI
ncbi:MAG: DUF72 domain-containing protein [Candidatus Lokiarchaeota archaeon]